MPRGKQYDIQKMLDLRSDGHSYKQIAETLNIKSVQSVRHALEKAARDDEIMDLLFRAKEEAETDKRIAEEEDRRKKLKEKMKPVKMGTYDFHISDLTFDALEYFLQKEYRGKVLIDKENSTISISEDIDPEQMRNFLYHKGFMILIDNNPILNLMNLNVEIFHSTPGSSISLEKEKSNPLHLSNSIIDAKRPILSLGELIKSGQIDFDGDILNIKDQSISLESIREKIRSTGYNGKIFYDPRSVFHYGGRILYQVKGNYFITMLDLPDSTVEEIIRSLWRNLYTKMFLRRLLLIVSSSGDIQAKDFFEKYCENVIHSFFASYPIEEIEFYQPYFEEMERLIATDPDPLKNFNEISISEIQKMISEDDPLFNLVKEKNNRIKASY
jgi:HPt (histidine-containing phosphotransfer) domain-containing protein